MNSLMDDVATSNDEHESNGIGDATNGEDMASKTNVNAVLARPGSILDDDDDDDIAVAAEAAANAVEEADAAAANAHELMDFEGAVDLVNFSAANEELHTNIKRKTDDEISIGGPPTCRVCGQSSESDGNVDRPLLHFEPTDILPSSSSNNKSIYAEHVYVHIFCGKTAGILFHKNPFSSHVHTKSTARYEIVSKAGIKSKHGTGPDVNAALSRSRWSMLPDKKKESTTPSKSKKRVSLASRQYYLMQEFEANLEVVWKEKLERGNEKKSIEGESRDRLVVVGGQMLDYMGAGHDMTNHPQFSEPLNSTDLFRSVISTSIDPPSTTLTQQDLSTTMASSPTTTATTTTNTATPPSSPPVGPYHPPFPSFGGIRLDQSAVAPAGKVEEGVGISLMNFSTFPTPSILHPMAGPLHVDRLPQHTKTDKPVPVRAAKTNAKHSAGLDHVRFDKHGNQIDDKGRVTCPCGGRHKADDGSALAKQSWRTHALTQQHQKWLGR